MDIKTVKELKELLETLPDDTKCTYDYGLGLEVEYHEEEHELDFH